MKIDFSSIIGAIFQGAIDEGRNQAVEFLKEITADAVQFVSAALPDIARYVELLATNAIDADEFKSLMMGLKDLAELTALTEVEKSEIKIQQTRNAILNAVTNVAIGAISKVI